MMNKFFALFSRRKKTATIGHIGHLHDSNEDILRIIKLYNHGTIKTINDDEALHKYPILLKYRASNLYIFITVGFSIISSVYMNCAISAMTPYIIENKIRSTHQTFNDDVIGYVSSCFYFAGLLGGSLLFGWLGCQVKQRKLLLIVGSLSLLVASGACALSTQYWMLFPAKFLQGISNACVWIISAAITGDAWPLSKWGTMVGFIGGLFPLGLTIGINGVGGLSNFVGYFVSYYTALGLCIATWMMQLLVIERSSIPESWLELKLVQDEPAIKEKEREHRETLDVQGGSWSKSSSLSTINLRDQPIIFENEKEAEAQTKDSIHNSIIFRVLTCIPVLSLLYQIAVIAIILETLKYTLLEKLESQMHIKNPVYQNIIVSTFLFPFSISAFLNGWFCDLFGSKMVGLTSVIISIPTLIWIGVPNQNIQSVVAALAMSGTTIGAMSISTFVSTIRAIQRVQLEDQHDLTKQQQQSLQREKSTLIFAIICILFGVGFFSSYFVAKLNDFIGFLWLCFSLAMLLATSIPLIAYFLKNKIRNTSQSSLASGKKSIVNNTRPKSFAESCSSDDDDSTLGFEPIESKAVIVVP